MADIKIDRSFVHTETWQNPELCRVWLWLLLSAREEGGRTRGMELGDGELLTSVREICDNTGCTAKAVRNILDALESQNLIFFSGAKKGQRKGKEITKLGTIVTICNYDSYLSPLEVSQEIEGQRKGKEKGKERAKKIYDQPIFSLLPIDLLSMISNACDEVKDEVKSMFFEGKKEEGGEERGLIIDRENVSDYGNSISNVTSNIYNNNILVNGAREEKPKSTKSTSKKKSTPTNPLAFVDRPGYVPIMEDWMAYKRERQETYKPIGLKACYTKLVRLSGGDADVAREIVKESMANNYAGLFPLKGKPAKKVSDPVLDCNTRFNPDEYDF